MDWKQLCWFTLLSTTTSVFAAPHNDTLKPAPSVLLSNMQECRYDGLHTIQSIETRGIPSSFSTSSKRAKNSEIDLLSKNISFANVNADFLALRSHMDHLKLLIDKNEIDFALNSHLFESAISASDILNDREWLDFFAAQLASRPWIATRRSHGADFLLRGTLYSSETLLSYLTGRSAILSDDKDSFALALKAMIGQIEKQKLGGKKVISERESKGLKLNPRTKYQIANIEDLAKSEFLLGKLIVEGRQKGWSTPMTSDVMFERAYQRLNDWCSSRLRTLFRRVVAENSKSRKVRQQAAYNNRSYETNIKFSPIMSVIFMSVTTHK